MLSRKDLYFGLGLFVFFLPFFLFHDVYEAYYRLNEAHGLLMSFIKFALLATLGEVIGLRIKTGRYHQSGFGLLPRAIVWGFLGMTIFMAFAIFAAGTPKLLAKIGLHGAETLLASGLSWGKVLVSFSISTALNLFYAPVLMTFHKITDIHIVSQGGTLKGFFTPIRFAAIFKMINWDVQWNFVFKRTIPLFWIPAQTITFLLPEEFRVLFAAFLGIVLGILLAIAALKQNEPDR
ncbi:MAG: Mpv17/PMP22 family protein [Bacteroidales bacterium]|nr:Mpv17/PMP22 family protein [Bacteroidales bacterium]